jgi:hypothetical protein
MPEKYAVKRLLFKRTLPPGRRTTLFSSPLGVSDDRLRVFSLYLPTINLAFQTASEESTANDAAC